MSFFEGWVVLQIIRLVIAGLTGQDIPVDTPPTFPTEDIPIEAPKDSKE